VAGCFNPAAQPRCAESSRLGVVTAERIRHIRRACLPYDPVDHQTAVGDLVRDGEHRVVTSAMNAEGSTNPDAFLALVDVVPQVATRSVNVWTDAFGGNQVGET